MLFLFQKEYLLNIKVYVVSLIYVQFNKRIIMYSSKRYGKPKDSYGLKQLEFGISRNVYLDSWGKRKIHSTFLLNIGRKESSYTEFIRLVLRGSDLYKNLIRLNIQLGFLYYSTNLTYLLANLEFLSLSWYMVKFRNKKLFLKEDQKLLNYQFELWLLNVIPLFKSGNFVFGSNLIFIDIKCSKFLYGDLIISQSIYTLIVIIFNCCNRQFMEVGELSKGVKLDCIRAHSKSMNWFLTGNLRFNKGLFMSIFTSQVSDQSFKDLVYKYLNSIYFNAFKELECYEHKMLCCVILNVYYSKFDEWVYESLVVRYTVNEHLTLCGTIFGHIKNVKLVYIRHLSNIFVGTLSSREISVELLNRVEEKFYGMAVDLKISSNFTLYLKRCIFLGYVISHNSYSLIQVKVPIEVVVKNLKKLGFLSKLGIPTRNGKYLNIELSNILRNYIRIELQILKQYYFSDNFDDFSKKVFYFLKYSCALTICSKMRLRTLRKTFKKYGSYLSVSDKEKVVSFKISNLKERVKNLLT
jgi:hypothetical protein